MEILVASPFATVLAEVGELRQGRRLMCVLGQLGSHPQPPSGMPEVGARTAASEFVSKQSGTEVAVRTVPCRSTVQQARMCTDTCGLRASPGPGSRLQAQLRRRNHRNLFQSRRCRGPCMAAWQGREEPSARQGSKLDPTPASLGGVPPGGPGGQVGRQVKVAEVARG